MIGVKFHFITDIDRKYTCQVVEEPVNNSILTSFQSKSMKHPFLAFRDDVSSKAPGNPCFQGYISE